MELGTVRWYNPAKGYGFIDTDEGVEAFVRYTAVDVDGFQALEQDERVEVDVRATDRGPEAVVVRPLGR